MKTLEQLQRENHFSYNEMFQVRTMQEFIKNVKNTPDDILQNIFWYALDKNFVHGAGILNAVLENLKEDSQS